MGSVTQYQQLQQRVQVSRKRSSEQGDNECSEPSKKPKEKTAETTKADLEDGANMSIQVEQVTLLSQQYISTESEEHGPCYIQSLYRRDRKVRRGEHNYGNLLKSLSTEGTEINVAFSGTNFGDPTTVFHLEASNKDKGAKAIRYDGNYYLAVDTDDHVKLRKLKSFPSEDKYFFHIKQTNPGRYPVTIQSKIAKGPYLHCGKEGKVSAYGEPDDLQTWFAIVPYGCEYIQKEAYEMSYTECETVTTTKAFEDTEDSAKGISLGHEGGASVDPDEGNYNYRVKRNSVEPGRGKSEGTGEGTPDVLKKGNSQESGTDVLEDPTEESYPHGDEATSV